MRRVTTLEERVLINELAEAEYTNGQIAEQVGWKEPTVRKWRARGHCQGRPGLVSKMGRPITGALGTFPSLIRETLRAWRVAHPGWGPKTLRAELEADGRFEGQPLPSLRGIARFLKEEELTRPYERHSPLPGSTRRSAQASHEEWEMDARGQQRIDAVGIITLINLNDRYSRGRLLSFPCLLGRERVERHPSTEDYQLVLRLAFAKWGLPDRLAVDHESVFYDNTTKSPFPTRFHLWLLALGVPLTFGRVHQATDQGMTERSHQTWQQQVLEGQRFADWTTLYHALQRRRDFLNNHLPCATLGEVPPLVAHPEACIPRRLYRPEWEADLLDVARIYAYLAEGRWFRQTSEAGTISLGHQVYILGRDWAREEMEVTFDPGDQHLVFHAPDGKEAKHLPLKGVTPETLMGEMGPLVSLPAFQLALPLTWDDWRVIRHFDTLGI